MNLQTRLLLGLAILVLAAVSSTGWLVLQVARVRLSGAQETDARLVGNHLVETLRDSYDPTLPLGDERNRRPLAGTAQSMENRGDVREVCIVDAQGTTVYGQGDEDVLVRAALTGASTVERRSASIFMYAPLRGAGGVAGAVRLKLPGDDALGAALQNARLLLFVVALFDGVMVMLFGLVFIRRVTGPLKDLAGLARRVSAGDLDVPALQRNASGDEIAQLTDDFNRMTASVKHQRDQLVSQEKLATVGRLAAGVAHEVGNPLAAVLGYVDLLLHDEPGGSEQRSTLERIRKETDRIRVIVSDLLEYSRPVKDAVEPVPLAEAVDATLSLLRPQARFRGIEVIQTIASELPAVAASASRLQQVLVNLLLNSADAMNGVGRITITGRRDGAQLVLDVTDTGPGVASADRSRIFDPFFTTKEPGQGTGLGLAISRSIVEAFGGSLILAETTAGATFSVRLPTWRVETIVSAT
jgi:signal transduction histidine kinase